LPPKKKTPTYGVTSNSPSRDQLASNAALFQQHSTSENPVLLTPSVGTLPILPSSSASSTPHGSLSIASLFQNAPPPPSSSAAAGAAHSSNGKDYSAMASAASSLASLPTPTSAHPANFHFLKPSTPSLGKQSHMTNTTATTIKDGASTNAADESGDVAVASVVPSTSGSSAKFNKKRLTVNTRTSAAAQAKAGTNTTSSTTTSSSTNHHQPTSNVATPCVTPSGGLMAFSLASQTPQPLSAQSSAALHSFLNSQFINTPTSTSPSLMSGPTQLSFNAEWMPYNSPKLPNVRESRSEKMRENLKV
jgi:hypothetical protein